MAFLPNRFRGEQPIAKVSKPSWLNKRVTPWLEAFTRISFSRPVYTVAVVAILASISYIGLLEDNRFGPTRSAGDVNWPILRESGRTLKAGEDTQWNWEKMRSWTDDTEKSNHVAVFTLEFLDQHPDSLHVDPPSSHNIISGSNAAINVIPRSSNSTQKGSDRELVFWVPYNQAPDLLASVQEISGPPARYQAKLGNRTSQGHWVVRTSTKRDRTSLVILAQVAWIRLSDLVRNAEPLDIAIMTLGYLAMYVTFASLFCSMRRMGSRFWLAANVLFSFFFAILFGLFVTNLFGIQISMLVIAEGLPFLVVIVGFEKNIVLTRSVLSHALECLRPRKDGRTERSKTDVQRSFTQAVINSAIRDSGYEVVKAYTVEVMVLSLGASSGVKGGFQQFCFFAAWVLFFDLLLLFSFYVAVLCIKLEVTKLKRYNELRNVLEAEGIDERVAEDVAQSADWSKIDSDDLPSRTIFGREIKSNHVHNYKVIMVSSFLLINAFNLYTVQVRGAKSVFDFSSWPSRFSGRMMQLLDMPAEGVSEALAYLLSQARVENQEVAVTILSPLQYEPSFVQSRAAANDTLRGVLGEDMGSQVVGSLLKSLEDPVLSKWIIVALALSVAMNGYLFSAATAGIQQTARRPIDRKELAHAQDFNAADIATTANIERRTGPPDAPPTPPSSDEESERKHTYDVKTSSESEQNPPMRSQEQMEKILADDRAKFLMDGEAIELSLQGKIPSHALEKRLGDFVRAVKVRRATIARNKATSNLTECLEYSKLPYRDYDWSKVFGACCENVIGYMPLPVGVAGPLVVDGQSYFIPMATTEGVLVASASRGCKAINFGGGAVTVLTDDGMTRGPCVSFETLERAGAAKLWLDSDAGQKTIKSAFNSTSRFARLDSLKAVIAGTKLYIRFKTTTGDAMGMNMISKGVEHALTMMMDDGFEDMNVVSVSGNYCSDKKAAALNWIEGRGKSVVAEAIIPGEAIRSILKTDVDSLVELNIAKNLIGSAMAGASGGFNAHAANIVAAIFIATGQDPAQVVESANCITTMQNLHGSLQISVSMPSIEVGTLGGGTILEPQGAMLDILGVRGPHPTTPGENARQLARIIAAATLAGELSLCSALAAGHLVRAHMQHNRSKES